MPIAPLVSIITATYNHRQYIAETIDSALAQTYPHCEVLVVDDGSTDGTAEMLSAQYGDQIRLWAKPNGGVSSARNLALRHAQGDYIQFLDSDDLLLPEKVATHVAYLEAHPEVGAVYSHALCFRDEQPEKRFEYSRKHLYRSGQLFASMLDQGYVLIHMPLIRREWVERAGPFDEQIPTCEDWEFMLRLAWVGTPFAYLEGEPLVLYRLRANSKSQNRVRHGLEAVRLLQKVCTYVTDPTAELHAKLVQAEGRWRFAYGKALVEKGQLRRGLWQMTRGILADRRDLDYKLTFMACCVLVGPAQASETLMQLKRRKDRVVARLLRRLEGAR